MLVRGEEGGNAINKLNRLIGPIIPEEKDPEEENPEGDEANKEGEENQDAENPEGSVIQWKLNLADTDLAENFDLKDTLQKIWASIFDI